MWPIFVSEAIRKGEVKDTRARVLLQRRARKGLFQSPTRKQGFISKPDAQARVYFKASKGLFQSASKGLFQSKQGCLRNAASSKQARVFLVSTHCLEKTLACASGFEENQPLL
jgi:hypothetical protein